MRSVIVSLVAVVVAMSAAEARAEACGELWYARNAVYKAAGYCFRTARGIRAFGNAGCQYDDVRDVPLSFNDRRRVDQILRDEAALGCRD